LNLKTLKKVTVASEYEEDTLAVLASLKICNPAVDTLTIMKAPSGADLKSLPKFFPNVTNLKISWSYNEDDYVRKEFDFVFDFEIDFESINSMKQIRKFEIDYLKEEMFSQLKLNQLQELYMTEESYFDEDAWFLQNELQTINAGWRTFINNHSQLKTLHLPQCKLNVEQVNITLENLPLLKNLELGVKAFNFGFATDLTKLSDEEYLAQYKKEQTERAAQLIGKNYDRLEHLHLNFDFWRVREVRDIILNHLEKYHSGVELYK
jgi:hypothetical protein